MILLSLGQRIKQKKDACYKQASLKEVRSEGLEPSRLAALDPKSNVATNYTTTAEFSAKIQQFFIFATHTEDKKRHPSRCHSFFRYFQDSGEQSSPPLPYVYYFLPVRFP